jgi:hypothetical protein
VEQRLGNSAVDCHSCSYAIKISVQVHNVQIRQNGDSEWGAIMWGAIMWGTIMWGTIICRNESMEGFFS